MTLKEDSPNSSSSHPNERPIPGASDLNVDSAAAPPTRATEECHDLELGKERERARDTPPGPEVIRNHISWLDFFLRARRNLKDCCCCHDRCWNALVYQNNCDGSGQYETVGHVVTHICCLVAATVLIVGLMLLIIWLTIGIEK